MKKEKELTEYGIISERKWITSDYFRGAALKEKGYKRLNIGDSVLIPDFVIPAVKVGDVTFPKVRVADESVVIVDMHGDEYTFKFDRILFKSEISNSDVADWKSSPLARYLSEHFLVALKKVFSAESCTLLSAEEITGALPYFQTEKDRISVDVNNETWWQWTRTRINASGFAVVGNNGGADWSTASYVSGVSPAFKSIIK